MNLSMIAVTSLRGRGYVFGGGVIEMPLIGLPCGAPRFVPADEAAYEGLGLLFCITTDAAGFAMCFQGG